MMAKEDDNGGSGAYRAGVALDGSSECSKMLRTVYMLSPLHSKTTLMYHN